jgi:hypothetical protein
MTGQGRTNSAGLCGRVAALALVVLLSNFAAAQEKRFVVGILPTYDSSGQSYGGNLSQLLTGMLYQQFALDPHFRPVFLNPGGLYDPTSTSYIAEYVQTLDTPLDMVLATNLIEPESPKHGDEILRLRSMQLDPKSGDAVQTWVSTTPIKDRSAMFDLGRTYVPTGMYDTGMMFKPNASVQRSPVGKAALELARQSEGMAVQQATKLTPSGIVVEHPQPPSCRMKLKVNYVEKHAISKSYSCVINEKEESLGIKEGILEVEEPARRLLIQIKLNDVPYKLPKQETYLLDPTLDCSSGHEFLNVNIGSAGEASTSWK